MDQTLLYGFILDNSTSIKAKSDINNNYNQGAGVLIGEPANYLITKAYLTDVRDNRLEYANNTRLDGKLELIYDAKRINTELLNNLTVEQQSCLFNIVECIYTQNTQQDNFVENKLTTDDNFTGYVAGTYHHSTESINVDALNASGLTANLKFANWIQFEFTTPEVDLVIKLWVSSTAFAKQYPYVTITNVIPPFDLNVLTDPGNLVQLGSLDILRSGSAYIFSKTNLEAIARDQNGIYTLYTKYVIDTKTSISIPFAIPYCGAHEPSSLDIRRAIRQYLNDNTLLTDEELKILFPEIYIDNRFYLIPVYDRYTSRAGKDFYPSIWSPVSLVQLAYRLYKDVSSAEFIDANLELITNSHNKMISLALPDENNSSIFSIAREHPTYQDYATTEAGFRYLDADAQELSTKFARAMAVANGLSVSDEFSVSTISDLEYIVFAQGDVEYLIMIKSSYDTLIEDV